MLFKQFNEANTYSGVLVPGVNLTTLQVQSKFDWHLDGLFMLSYLYKDYTFEVGYRVYARDCEKLTVCDAIEGNFGIKGTTYVCAASLPPQMTTNQTESKSTISTASAVDTTPVYLTLRDIDVEGGALPSIVSHSVFVDAGYTWADSEYPKFANLNAYIQKGDDNTSPDVWGVGLKLGISYS